MYCIWLLLTWILSFGRGEKVHKLANVNNKKSNLKRNWFVEGNQRINSRQEVKRQRALKKLLLGLLLVVCPVSCLVQSRTTCPGVGLPTAAWSSHINNQWRKCPLLIIAEILFIFFFFFRRAVNYMSVHILRQFLSWLFLYLKCPCSCQVDIN